MKEESMEPEAFSPEESLVENIGLLEAEYDDDDDEGYESFAEYDDDDEGAEAAEYDDDESADAEFLLGAAAPLLGGLATTVGPALIKGVSNIFRPKSRRTRKYRGFARSLGFGQGVRGARIRTPRGSAFLRLPKSVVPISTYRKDLARLQARDNRLNGRINRTQRDLTKTDKKAARALAQASSASLGINRLRQKTQKDISKLKDDQKSNSTMNLLLSMMQMQNLSTQLTGHTHDASGNAENVSPANNMMMMLPLMLMDDGGDDNTMMMMMMMMMTQQQK